MNNETFNNHIVQLLKGELEEFTNSINFGKISHERFLQEWKEHWNGVKYHLMEDVYREYEMKNGIDYLDDDYYTDEYKDNLRKQVLGGYIVTFSDEDREEVSKLYPNNTPKCN